MVLIYIILVAIGFASYKLVGLVAATIITATVAVVGYVTALILMRFFPDTCVKCGGTRLQENSYTSLFVPCIWTQLQCLECGAIQYEEVSNDE